MTSESTQTGNSPDVQPSAPQRQPGDTTGQSDAAVAPSGTGQSDQSQDQPSFHPFSVEEAVSHLWDHLGMGRRIVVDQEQPKP